MKKTLLLLLCVSMSYALMAQETVKKKEVGLVFSSLNQFGLTYKTGTDKSLWRFNTLFLSGDNMKNTSDSTVGKQNSMGFGVKIGKEYRKNIIEKLEFRYGADLSFSYSHSKSTYNDNTIYSYERFNEQTSYTPGVNLVLGLNYLISENLIIGAEVLPYFRYTSGTAKEKNRQYGDIVFENDISGFSYGLSNSSVLLSLVYRF